MKLTHRKRLTAATAMVGAFALTFGGSALAASAEEPSPEVAEINVGLEGYALASAITEKSEAELKALEKANVIQVSEKGFVLHIDEARSGATLSADSTENFTDLFAAPIPGDPVGGSRPGAPVTIYLDFDGETLEGTHWNTETGIETIEFAPAASADAAFQAEVWAAVAEDWAPFNVNVTTTRPSDAALYKTSEDDNEYGAHVIITDTYEDFPLAPGTGGLAWFGGTGSDYLSGALVFTEGVGGGDIAAATAKNIAFTASHEAGHNFGLEHHGIGDDEYYYPVDGLWGPLMGAPYEVPLTQWSDGSYAGATTPEQDDLATITDRSAAEYFLLSITTQDGEPYDGPVCPVGDANPSDPQPGDEFLEVVDGECGDPLILTWTFTDRADFIADEVGNTPADAASLDNADGTFETAGVIITSDDVDVYRLVTIGGPLTATIEVADINPNLDSRLTLTDEEGTVIAEDDPDAVRISADEAGGLGAEITEIVEAGVYYLSVEGVGFGDPSTATPDDAGGYSDYGSIGNYTLSGIAEPFVTDPIVIVSPADGTEVVGGEDVTVTGTATPEATVTVSVDGSSVAEVTADEDGNWTALVTANDYGNTEIEAAQSVAGIDLDSDSVTVWAPVEAPVILNPADGTSSEDPTLSVSGTGIATATVAVTVVGEDGEEITGTATVDADGIWELTLDGELAPGVYEITARQSINGVTSDAAGPVTITILAVDDDDADADADADGADGTDADDTDADADADADGNADDDLAETGGFDAAPFVILGGVVLLAGAATLAFGLQRRKQLALEQES